MTVHRSDCPNVVFATEKDRVVEVFWGPDSELLNAGLRVSGWDRVGLARDVAAVCADEGVNMVAFVTGQPQDGSVTLTFTVEPSDLRQLQRVIHKIDDIPGVTNVEREF